MRKTRVVIGGKSIEVDFDRDFTALVDLKYWYQSVLCAEYILDNEEEFGITDPDEAMEVAREAWEDIYENIGELENETIESVIERRK